MSADDPFEDSQQVKQRRIAKTETVSAWLPRVYALFPDSVHVRLNPGSDDELTDLLYEIWDDGYQGGDADGYDRGCEDTEAHYAEDEEE